MALTDRAVLNSKPKDKAYKVADSGGLFLFVTPAGGKSWRYKFRIGGSEKLLTLGKYPQVSLSEARKAGSLHKSLIVILCRYRRRV